MLSLPPVHSGQYGINQLKFRLMLHGGFSVLEKNDTFDVNQPAVVTLLTRPVNPKYIGEKMPPI